MDPDPEYESGSTKLLNSDPIRIRIHNTAANNLKTTTSPPCVQEGEEEPVAVKKSVAEKILQGKTVSAGTFQSDFDLREALTLFL